MATAAHSTMLQTIKILLPSRKFINSSSEIGLEPHQSELFLVSGRLGSVSGVAWCQKFPIRFGERWNIVNVLFGTTPSPAEADEVARTGKSSDAKWHS